MKKNIFLIVAVVIILLAFPVYFHFVSGIYTASADRGQFGDAFGALNTLFSGLAFLGLIYAILLQREELSLQRTELSLTRDELKKSAEAQAKQAASLKATAKINGKSSILEYHNTMHQVARSIGNDGQYHKSEGERLVREIETLIEDK